MSQTSKYFYGHEVSELGIKNKRVDYAALSKCGDIVLCNDIVKLFNRSIGGEFVEPKLVNGYLTDDDQIQGLQSEILQYYIISDDFAELLQDCTNEIVFYIDALRIYVWGVTHCGTSWDYVLTDIELDDDEK